MRKTTMIAIVALALFAACFAFLMMETGQAQGATIYVNSVASGSNNGTSWDDAYTDLQSALPGAPADQIWVASGTYTPGTTRNDYFLIGNGVEVYGGFPSSGSPTWGDRDWANNPTILSGDIGTTGDNSDNCYHILYVWNGVLAPYTYTLDGFTVSGGNAGTTEWGGGLYNYNTSPVISNCLFTGNTANKGGGLSTSYSNVTVSNCIFIGNYATGQYSGGGGMWTSTGTATVTNCIFDSNSASGSSGGHGAGMGNYVSAATLTDCTFNNNTAGGSGGGLYNRNSVVSVTSGTFTNNSATNRGAGMTSSADQMSGIAKATVIDCLFDSNTSSDSGGGIYFSEYMAISSSGTVTGCTFTSNTATGGGGIQSYETSLSITDCLFDSNTATVFDGGGLSCGGSAGEVRVSGSSFTGNSAPYGGGVSNNYRIILTDCSFTGNSAQDGGGFRDNQSNSASIKDCTFMGNTASNRGAAVDNYGQVSPIYTNCTFTGNIASQSGGAMHNEGWGAGCIPQITNCIFSGNSSTDYGGAIYDYTGAAPIITNCTFNGNNTGILGGALYNQSWAGTPTITNSILWGNTPDQVFASQPVIINYCDVQSGFAGTGNIDQDPLFVGGGDLHLTDTSPCINAGTNSAVPPGVTEDIDGEPRIQTGIVDMGADEVPGPIFVDIDATGANNGSSWTDAFVNLQDGLAAATPGKQIWVAAGTYTPVLPGSPGQRTDSFAMKNGVAIYGGFVGIENNRADRDWQTNLTILSGEILNPGTPDNCYHVFYHPAGPDGTAILDGFIISGGNANGGGNDNYGGGMYNNGGSPTITNCIFSDNNASWDGGGMYVVGDGTAPTLTDCVFQDNIAGNGGGIYNYLDTAPVINGGTFSRNQATGNGGGMVNQENDAVINGTAFISNTATLNGGGVFNEFGTTPQFTDCVFSDNNANNGGGMYNDDVSPPVIDCVFLNNTANYGGGMYNSGSTVDLSGSSFIGNTASDDGGAIYNIGSSGTITGCTFGGPNPGSGNAAWQGGGIFNSNSSPDITACLFLYNSGTNGGAMYNTDYSHPVITSGTFAFNTAGNDGGGIYSDGNVIGGCDIVLTNCYFEYNIAGSRGGGFFNNYGDPTITDCVFDTNEAASSGGGIYHYYGDPVINGCYFWYNSGSYGGGIYNAGDSSSLVINSGTFTDNTAYLSGGGIYNDNSGNILSPGTISNCYFSLNSAGQDGGGMYNYQDYHSILNCTFEDNSAAGDGGGIYTFRSYSYIKGNIFRHNTASVMGGAVTNDGGDTPEYVDCEFYNNTAQLGGGMASFWAIDTPVTNCLFWYNTGSVGGGMYNWDDANTIVTNCTFYQNTASGSGSGIFNGLNSSPVITNCILWDDPLNEVVSDAISSAIITYSDILGWASGGSGNINLDPLFVNPATGDFHLMASSPCIDTGTNSAVPAGITADFEGDARIQDCYSDGSTIVDMGIDEAFYISPAEVWVNDDWAGYSPGTPIGTHTFGYDAFAVIQDGINAVAPSGIVKVASGTYTQVNPLGPGTQVAYVNKTLTLAGGYVTTDWITPDPITNLTTIDPQGNGRGIFWAASSGSISGFTVTNGNATDGGGMRSEGSFYLTECIFRNNSSGGGGGIYINSGTSSLFNCVFEGNTSTYTGGGITNGGGCLLTVIGCDFLNNHADVYYGGGIHASAFPLTVTDCLFSGNSVGGSGPFWQGGAIYAIGPNVNLINCVFLSNTSIDDAGAVYVSGSGPMLTNCTFWNNSAANNGGALHASDTAIVTNCIFWGDTPNEIVFSGTPTVTYCDVEGGYPGTGNMNQDPLFVNTGGGDLRLQGISPCINTGSDTAPGLTGITTDFDGNPRLIGTVDMGAFEMPMDFGDAPDPAYPTLLANNGARHYGGPLFLGATKDLEIDGQPLAGAYGDDNNNIDDEDGVVFTSTLLAHPTLAGTATVNVTSSGTGMLDAWIDFNRDGDWADPGEQVFSSIPLTAGVNGLSFTVPAGSNSGSSCARFRLSSVGGLTDTGLALDGEVEDHQVMISGYIPPAITGLSITSPVNEGSACILSGSITGPNPVAPLTLLVYWDDGSSGTFTYTAGTGFFSETHIYDDGLSFYNVNLTIIDDWLSGSNTYSIPVTVNNVPPTANNDSYLANEGQTLTVAATGVLSNDTDPAGVVNDPLTVISVGTATLKGSLTWNPDGSFSYRDNGAFSPLLIGEVATDQFTYIIDDGDSGTATATVTISIKGKTSVPVVPIYFTYFLDVSVYPEGGGIVVTSPPGRAHVNGTVITLTAVAANGFIFDGWSGDLTGDNNPTTLVMDSDKYVMASFLSTVEPSPTPTPSPTAEPTPTPTPTPEPTTGPGPTTTPEATPEPTVEPTPTPEPTVTPSPTSTVEPTEEPDDDNGGGGGGGIPWWVILIIVAVLCLGVGGYFWWQYRG